MNSQTNTQKISLSSFLLIWTSLRILQQPFSLSWRALLRHFPLKTAHTWRILADSPPRAFLKGTEHAKLSMCMSCPLLFYWSKTRPVYIQVCSHTPLVSFLVNSIQRQHHFPYSTSTKYALSFWVAFSFSDSLPTSHTHTHTHTHSHTHIHTYIHTHTYTHSLTHSLI